MLSCWGGEEAGIGRGFELRSVFLFNSSHQGHYCWSKELNKWSKVPTTGRLVMSNPPPMPGLPLPQRLNIDKCISIDTPCQTQHKPGQERQEYDALGLSCLGEEPRMRWRWTFSCLQKENVKLSAIRLTCPKREGGGYSCTHLPYTQPVDVPSVSGISAFC